MAYWRGQPLPAGQCISVVLPYRRENGRVLLVVEPALMGQEGRLRLDTLVLQDDRLTQSVPIANGRRVPVEFVRGGEAATC